MGHQDGQSAHSGRMGTRDNRKRTKERQIEAELRKWKLGTALLGIAFAAACAGVVPFLAGYSLHEHWDPIGKKILLLAMGLFLPFVFVTTMYLIQWNYLRSIKRLTSITLPRILSTKNTEGCGQ
jgi:hypothetical protein